MLYRTKCDFTISKNKKFPGMCICKASIPSTCMGIKMRVSGFPHSSQDGEMMSCAETTVWSILEYFGNKYSEYRPVMPSDILAALKPFAYERQLPSGGLSFEQISSALKTKDLDVRSMNKQILCLRNSLHVISKVEYL